MAFIIMNKRKLVSIVGFVKFAKIKILAYNVGRVIKLHLITANQIVIQPA